MGRIHVGTARDVPRTAPRFSQSPRRLSARRPLSLCHADAMSANGLYPFVVIDPGRPLGTVCQA